MGSSPPPFSNSLSGEDSSSSSGDFVPFLVPPPLPGKRPGKSQTPPIEGGTEARPPSLAPTEPRKSVPPVQNGNVGVRGNGPLNRSRVGKPASPARGQQLSTETFFEVPKRYRESKWQKLRQKFWGYLSRDERQMPSWIISLCVHVTILLVLALIPMITERATVFNLLLNSDDGGGGELESYDLAAGADFHDMEVTNDSLSLESMSIESNIASIVEQAAPVASTSLATASSDPVAISMGLSGRSGTMKGALLGAYGGNKATEDAVDLGLQWLVRNQTKDGSWTLNGPYANGSSQVNRLAATSMALIAFAGAGNTHKEGKYSETVAKGLKQLVRWQNDEGRFNPPGHVPDQHMAYSHAQATIALCELYGMTRDAELRKAAQLAVNFSQDWQDENKGGWRYYPRSDSDLSVTGWYVMALISARMAGLSTNQQVLERADKFLNTVSGYGGSLYFYTDYSVPADREAPVLDLSMTAEGLLCRMYLGWAPTDPRVRRGATMLGNHPISIDVQGRNYYYWYYCTQTMHHIGDPLWSGWNDVMREALPALQLKTGREAGSFPPQGDPHEPIGGRLYTTCLAIYCLEVYYRHLPLYSSNSHNTLN